METKYIDEINTIERLIDRSKDTNIIYLTEDTILNTKAVQKIANRLEQLEKENKELKSTLKCTQDSWFEDTKKIEEMQKELDVTNEANIALKIALDDRIPKSVIREKINKRQSELIQELKTFKDDIRLNTLQEIYYGEEK